MSELSAAAKRDRLAQLLRERAARTGASRPGSPSGLAAARTSGPPLIPIARDGDLAASFGQERIWFLEQLQPESLAYNLLARIGFSGPLDIEALRRGVEAIVARHEVLRTTFPSVDGRPVQRIASAPTWVLPLRDLRSLLGPARETEAECLTRAEVTAPFDLAAGPLLRTVLLRLADDEHVLVLTLHHIVSDAWSVNIFFQELAAFYTASVAGEPLALSALPVQYADFAHWQRGWLTGEVLETQRIYWMERLSGELPVLDLPSDRPRPAVPKLAGATGSGVIHLAVLAGLRDLSRREGVTLFTTLLAAFKTLLLRYTGQEDLIVATPVAGRSRPEIERLMGFFVNTLVLRTDLSGDPSFRETLRRTRDIVVGAHAHADFPFERLVEELQPERDLSRGPLFQVAFNMLSFGFGAELPFSGVRARPLPSLDLHVIADGLMLYVSEGRDSLDLCFVYSPEIFDAETIGRLEAHFQTLLAGIVADPDRPLSRLPLLPEEERHRLLVEWNATDAAFPLDDTFAAQFAAQVARTPQAVAVVSDEGALTYRELDARAIRLARRLVDSGVGSDRVVALLAERSLDLLTWILAVFKAAGAYLPLDPRHPAARHAGILSSSRAVLVLVADEYVGGLEDALAQMDASIRPTILRAAEVRGLAADLDPAASGGRPSDLAYVIYTSGSTGSPKGAMVEHVGMLNHLHAKIRDLGLTSGDTVAQTASQCFDISVWQFLAPLLVGGRVRIVADDVAHDAPRLLDLIGGEAITVVEVVPSVLASAFHDEAGVQVASPALAALRWLVVTGEAAPVALCRRWMLAYPRCALMNGYGPTECSDDVTHHVMTEPPPPDATQVPIGRPIANMRVYVLDRTMTPMPIGVPGELCVGGIGVGRGYLEDPERTAEVFIADPFSARPDARLYRTGDLARWRADGTLEFLGRLDHQVKIRGFRIELGEIEAGLGRHPGVREAVVVAREDSRGERRLAAYVVARGEAPPATEIRGFLARTLPDYMLPESVVFLPALPLTPNGKVDRRRLPEPDLLPRAQASAPPRTPAEEVIANVWADVLGLEKIGIHENFFELGGHSLLATRVVSRLRQVFGVDLPVRRMFEAPTVQGLAAHVEAARRAADVTAAPRLRPLARGDASPLSFAQQRLWFIAQLEPGTTTYNIPLVLELRGSLDVSALEAAVSQIIRRHETLRTTFVARGSLPVQRIEPPSPRSIAVVDLRALEPAARETEARRLAVEDGGRPFDLARGPLLRMTLLRLETETYHLLLTAHHIVIDGWSLEVFFRELLTLYPAFAAGEPASLPPLPVQYADVSEWQRLRLEGEALEAHLEPWRRRLAGVPELDLPTDYPRPSLAASRGAVVSRVLAPELTSGLQALSRRQGVTLFMTLLAGFAALLARYSGQDDIAVGVPVAGRTRPEMEPLLGLFVNTLVLRTSLAGDPTGRELLHRVREVALEAYTHQEVPFERLVQALQPVRDSGRNPLFQVLFNMVEVRTPLRSELAGLALSVVSTEQLVAAYDLSAKFDLSLNAWSLDGTVGLRLVYNAQLFAPSTMERLLHHLERLLTGLVTMPETPVAALPLLDDAERERMLVHWNDTRSEFPDDRGLHELFEAAAARTPDAIAITFEEATLTYRALNERANRVAHRLRSMGVGSEVVVGLCVERSLEMVIGLLGILKAGGAYMPLDPDLPRQRLGFMLADAGVRVLVTQQRLQDRLPGAEAVLCLDDGGMTGEPTVNPSSGAGPDTLAYVLYTSGSTGQPKGTMVEHRSLVNYVTWVNRCLLTAPVETIPTVFKFTFDGSLKQLFAPLLSGRSVWVLPDDVAVDPEALLRRIGGRAGVALNCVPSLWRAMLDALAAGAPRPPAGSLVSVMLGGESMTAELVARSFEAFPGLQLWNVYGPTETTCNATAGRVDRDGPVTIGRPIANTQVYVLDARQHPVPVGLPGELYVGGVGLARGYFARPELTAEKFVPDPFRLAPGARLYRTGDRARYLADGRIEFLGRRDHQVKVRGFRIELEEIEATLRRHPQVRDAAVVAHTPDGRETRLIGYLVPVAGTAPPGRDLRQWLKAVLPDYMVPSSFVMLAALPRTSAGKVDRASLPPPAAASSVGEATPPRTPTEMLVAGIWSEVLGVAAVGVEDNFFELGGHSLLATQVLSRLRTALQIDLPLRTLFEASTLEELAEVVDTNRRAGASAAALPLAPVARTGPLAVSFQQERLWFFDQFEPGSATFNMSLSLRVAGRLEPVALRHSLETIWRRHESLRTTFGAVDGRPVQVIAPPGELPLALTDLRDLEPAARRSELERCAMEQAQQPFDLAQGPLARARLFRLADTEHVLVVTAHHIVADGWSFSILLRELIALYPAFVREAPSPLPELAIQYADYADWQRRSMDGAALESSLAYWRRTLAGASPLELPTDRPRPARQTFRGAGVPLTLSPEVSGGLQALARREGATVFMTLLAAFKALLARHTGREDVVVGAPVAGRTRPETETLIGFFLNTVGLRDDLSGDPAFREILARVRSTVLEALANQDAPFEKVVEALRPERDLSRTPLFQVFFNFLNFPRTLSPQGSELTISPLTPDLRSLALDLPAKFDLSLYASDLPHGISLFLLYNADLFEATTAATLMYHLEALLTAVVKAADTPLSALPLVSDAERETLAIRPVRPFVEFPPPDDVGSVPDRFRAIVALHADRVAVESEGTKWTYRDLDAMADRVARAVQGAIGSHGGRVGLLLPHDAPMVAAVFGVLRSGNAYVPLDPLYPRERLAFMLADAEAGVLVTDTRHLGLARELGAGSVRIVNLDEPEPTAVPGVEAAVPPEAMAYLLYTSGSTGQPKGVVQNHRNVLHHIGVYTNNLHIAPEDRLALLASFSFDAAVMDIFGALLNGATLCLRDVRAHGVERLAEWLARERITIYHSTPTLYRALLIGLPAGCTFPDVRLVVLGGEEVVRRDVELHRRHFSADCLFVNGLGPTESTVSFQHFIDRGTPLAGTSVPVGFAVAETELVLLDAAGRPATLTGEIGIRSPHVALGYWRRPELTAAAFLPDPGGGPRRLYRTGDLGRRRPDGTLEFLGRRDDQVKVRGFRIEPAEVEAVIDSHSAVRRSVVVARGNSDGERYLAAYVIPGTEPPPTVGALQAHVQARLPAYMVPSVFVTVAAFPLTPSGKVDRRALPAVGRLERARGDAATAPRTPVEAALAAIWTEVLGIDGVGVEDNFFELGGHSLMATRVLSRLRARLHAEVPLRALFEAPTIAALAALVEVQQAAPVVENGREEIDL